MNEELLLEAIRKAKHSLYLEGLEVTPEEEELILKRLREEITHEEFLMLAKEAALRVGEEKSSK